MTSLLNIAGNIPVSAAAVGGQSLRFEDGDSPYLSWTPASAGSTTTWTFSCWFKLGNIGTSNLGYFFNARTDSNNYMSIGINTNGTDWLQYQSSTTARLITSQVFRDPSAWYNMVCVWDSGNATSSDRMRMYINGSRVTSFSTETQPSSSRASLINDAKAHRIGDGNNGVTEYYWDGYLANVTFIDGQALDATSFGEYEDTLWKPKSDTAIQALTFGTNGFYLPMKQTTEAEGFSTVTYTGNGGTQSIEGVGFEPDFVWVKNRSSALDHRLFDSVRGANETLFSNTTSAEYTDTDQLMSFDTSGFTVGSDTGVNQSSSNYVAWCWDAGTGSAVSNTDGSITSTVKANTAKGFSITSYVGNATAGATVGHGLSSAPEMMIIKDRSDTDNWPVYHTALGNTKSIFLNKTDASSTLPYWNNTTPSSSVFTLGANLIVNESGDDFIAYCFHSVSGYSDLGSYSGTGSSVSVTTGFKPAFLLLKNADDNTAAWIIFDSTRNVTNPRDLRLDPNSSDAESTFTNGIDFNSNGFTINATGLSQSGDDYIYMAFADTRNATFFGDTSGNGNNWTPNALNNTDVVPDSPVSGGNFATHNSALNSTVTLSEGNLKTTQASAAFRTIVATFGVSSGKWYWEVQNTGNDWQFIGIVPDTFGNMTLHVGQTADSYAYYSTSVKYNNNTPASYGATYGAGDIIGVALDMDAGTLTFYKNNVSQGQAYSGISGTYLPAESFWTSDSIANFGQDSSFAGTKTPQGNTDDNGVGDFYYAPPSGFLALTTGNLPAPTITAPDEYFNTVLYTGTGATRSVTGFGHQPDWLWTKARSNASNHNLIDAVRGTNKLLLSDVTDAEYTQTIIDSFDSDGFTTSSAASGINLSGYTYAAWSWKAGGTAVSNTDGAMTSSVSANTDAGFSIVTFTSPATSSTAFTVGHGLSSAPEMIITKERDGTLGWLVYHDELPSPKDNYLLLNSTAGNSGTITDCWGTSAPTSSVFGMKTTVSINTSKSTIAYCFHSVPQYSKCGVYTGNGSSDGTFVHCGFRPAWIMVKRTDNTGNWWIHDAKRNTYNVVDNYLFANSSNAEASYDNLDILSNGFKLRLATYQPNTSGGSFIFLAFAEAPFSKSNAR